jgi:hypothetical protein
MPRKIRNQFKLVKIKASTFNNQGSTENTDRLDQLHVFLEAKKVEAVAAERKSILATQEATIKRAEAVTAELALIQAASEFDNRIAGERVWMVYREGDSNDLVFEGITERLLRNNFRAHQAAIGKSMDEDGSNELDSMFEDEQEDEE